MTNDYTLPLWLLKLWAFVNLDFLANSLALPSGGTDPHIVVPAEILFVVSAHRCLSPNRDEDNVVLHASPLVTRLSLYVYEEVGGAVIFAADTAASAYLYVTLDALGDGGSCRHLRCPGCIA